MTYFCTARLDARRFTAADVAAFTAYRADPDVARYQSWDAFTRAEGEALVESMRGADLGTPGQWVQLALEDRSRGVLVGDLACKVNAAEPREMEVGFTLAAAEQGRGYATEALTALLDHAFTAMGLRRVVAVIDVRNAPAAALLVRVGMRREAHFIDNVFFKGTWGSELLFAKLAREHHPAPARASDPARTPPRQARSQEEPDDHR